MFHDDDNLGLRFEYNDGTAGVTSGLTGNYIESKVSKSDLPSFFKRAIATRNDWE